MKIGQYFYEILGVKPGSGLEEIKRAYRILVRKNHPDLFPNPQKDLQELKMIQINEAYARLTEKVKLEKDFEEPQDEESTNKNVLNHTWSVGHRPAGRNEVGFHKDIQYAYYKQGFNNFSKALSGIKRTERRSYLRGDLYYLRRFANSLFYLRKADGYFSKLLELYPDSIWSRDASIKMKKAEYFNRLYRKILLNIERKLKEKS